jgi:hypothetical protein
MQESTIYRSIQEETEFMEITLEILLWQKIRVDRRFYCIKEN